MQGRLPRFLLSAAILSIAVIACRSATVADDAVYACNDGKCPEPLVCQEGFCVSPQASTSTDACTPFTCDLLGKNCGTVSDGCGGTLDCGACSGKASCGGGGVTNVCGCTPIPEASVCADAGIGCGSFFFSDGCNPPKTISCGGCGSGQTCNAGSCCTPETGIQVCAEHNITCGTPTLVDRCGQHRTINCGGCDAGFLCVEADDGQACVECSPETDQDFCMRQGFACGTASGTDNCGVTRTGVDCGGCTDGGCGASGVANQCECLPILNGCSQNDQCCSGSCGPASLCCIAQGAVCNDDSDCCNGWCTFNASRDAGICVGTDGGF
ncbi:MAG: hypothetical protein ACJ790_18225 [Myxococcaceae bacterium]